MNAELSKVRYENTELRTQLQLPREPIKEDPNLILECDLLVAYFKNKFDDDDMTFDQ